MTQQTATRVVDVRMLAFGKPGEIRQVSVPNPADDLRGLLAQVFEFGQNDFQPQPHPSVSCGDVVQLDAAGPFYLCLPLGWHRMNAAEFSDYVNLSEIERMRARYALTDDV